MLSVTLLNDGKANQTKLSNRVYKHKNLVEQLPRRRTRKHRIQSWSFEALKDNLNALGILNQLGQVTEGLSEIV